MSPKVIKCIIVGDSRIDTAKLIMQKLASQCRNGSKILTGCEFGVIRLVVGDETIILQIQDLNITDQFNHMWHVHCNGSHCALMPFVISKNGKSYLKLAKMIHKIRSMAGEIPILLLGCFDDLSSSVKPSKGKIEKFIKQWPDIFYKQISISNQDLSAILIPVALLGVNHLGISIESLNRQNPDHDGISQRLIENDRKQKAQLEEFYVTIEEMGFSIDQNNLVEISNGLGTFSIDISKKLVHFKPTNCISCKRFGCMTRYNASSNTLCITSLSDGWSNIDLNNQYLLILSEIIAIYENNLPTHVIGQIKRICPGYCPSDLSFKPKIIHSRFLRSNLTLPQANLNKNTQPSEARTLLRFYYNQFKTGQIPYTLYESLKKRYKKY